MSEKQNLTIDDIARELGVSKTTISRAISGKGRIGADTRARILEYIEKCNYLQPGSGAAEILHQAGPAPCPSEHERHL